MAVLLWLGSVVVGLAHVGSWALPWNLTIDSFSSLGYCSDMTEGLKHTIRVVMGDPSGDGHGRTSSDLIKSSLNRSEIQDAYEAGSKILGFDLVELEKNRRSRRILSDENVAALAANGYEIEGGEVWKEEYMHLFLWVAKLGNPSFVHEFCREAVPQLEIGGYNYF